MVHPGMKGDKLSTVADCGLAISYWLLPDRLTIRLFGVIPLHRIALGEVAYFRLASSDEVPRWFFFRNWKHFSPPTVAYCPVYVLKTNRRKKVYLKLRGGAHFRLRTAIGRSRCKAAEEAANAGDQDPAALAT